MNGLVYLTWNYLRRRPGPSALLAACLGIALLLPAVTHVLTSGFEDALRERSDATPLVLGAAGPPLDLTLAGLYFSRDGLEPLTTGLARRIGAREDLLAVPLDLEFTTRGRALVGTVPEYFEERGIVARTGHLPFVAGEVVLGAALARELELGVDDHLFSDPPDHLDLSRPSALKLRVCGVLHPTRSADDRAAFVTLETCWVLHGLAHGHDDVTTGTVDPSLILGQSDEEVRMSNAFIPYNEITPQNRATFHLHTDPDVLPLSCVLVFPRTAKAATLLKAETNIERMYGPVQVADTRAELDELLDLVLGLRRLLDGVALVLLGATAALGALVLGLSMKLRTAELRTLDRLGSSARTVALLQGLQIAFIAAVALACAGLVLGALLVLDPDLTLLL
ncbi:hypothetical protein Pla163_16550 [Planctomycetes bacterium Pla163]|uniref:FtsX-like permease family protein n=1 Tax=Rohdeia mirabilis TaxID=2528008 RepID=A0A518CZ89_9BACT|nr:hypothetical protein Pla163_16550 [Planctomycetes bacterium Pla163]